MKRVLVTVLLTSLVLCVCAQAASVRQFEEDGFSMVEIENRHFTVKIAVDSGGRIASWVDKESNVDQVWWKGDGRSGLLDDKGDFTGLPYTATIEEEGPETVVVSLAAPENGWRQVKRITVLDDEPAIRVEYTYANTGEEVLEGWTMVRNWVNPGGTVGAEDHYFFNGHRGVEEKVWPYAGQGAWHEVARRWSAGVDTESKLGVAMVIDFPLVHRIHNWQESGVNATMEWEVVYKLQLGESISVPVTLALLRGMGGVTDADSQLVLNLRFDSEDRKLMMEGEAYPLAPLAGDRPIEVRVRYETLDRTFVWEETALRFENVTPGVVTEARGTYVAPEPGTYVLVFQTRKGTQQLNTFEMPMDIGASSGSYFKGKREEETTRDLVLLNDRDVANGYVLHWGGPEAPFPRPVRRRS